MFYGMKGFTGSEVAQKRLQIINFYEVHGEKTTKEAFGVGRKTIFVWKKRLTGSQGRINSLCPASTKPKSFRMMNTDPKICEFIREIRKAYPRLGKEKIYPLLDEYCKENNLVCIKESTIGKVIKRNNFYYQKSVRSYHNPNSKYAKNRLKVRKFRVKHTPTYQELGHIQIDTVLRFQDGIKYYFFDAIDIKGKFAFSLPFKTLTSSNTVDFMKKLMQVIPYKIIDIQTDNGLEFLGEFEKYLNFLNILHIFTYPRCPKINGCVERFNRSIQEEFINENLDTIHTPKVFTSKLINYLLFYNCKRIHKSLGNQTPMAYLLQQKGMSEMCVTYTQT